MKPAAVARILLATLAVNGASATALAQAAQAPSPVQAHCEVAVVNPVSGYAECVKPPGAPVDPPPPRPPPSPEVCARHPELGAAACQDAGLQPADGK
jgi:hypothetical protein